MEPDQNTCQCSVVIPIYNSEKSLSTLLTELIVAMTKNAISYEIICINDGSTDDSEKVINEFALKYPDIVHYVHRTYNLGQHIATLEGIKKAKGKSVVTIDDDLQFPPSEIVNLIENQMKTNAELVYGTPRFRKHSTARNIASRVALFFFHHVVGTCKKATSFRLINKTLAKKIIDTKQTIVFIDGMLAKHNPKTSYVFVEHRERPVGKSGHNLIKQGWWTLKILCYYSRRY